MVIMIKFIGMDYPSCHDLIEKARNFVLRIRLGYVIC